MKARGESPREKERRDGVEFELRAHRVEINIFERVGNEQAGVLDQEVNVVVREAFGELRPRGGLSRPGHPGSRA